MALRCAPPACRNPEKERNEEKNSCHAMVFRAGDWPAQCHEEGFAMCRTLIVLLLVMGLTAGPCRMAGATSRSPVARAAVVPHNLNEITLEQLDELPGIGPALAERIIAYRDEQGPFTRIEQLNEVKGIGERTLEKLRPYLTLD